MKSSSVMSLRVAARYQRAHEFPTPEALQKYLKDHPDADPKNHSVKKPGEHKPEAPEKAEHGEKKPEEGHGGGHDHHDKKPKPKTSWKDLVTNLSAKAKEFVKKAPGEVKKFVEDESFRRNALMKAHKAVVEAPEKIAKQAYEAAKHEVKEFKTAGEGVKAVLSGKKMSHEQKHAFKAVAKHVAMSVAVGALGGALGGATAVGQGVARSFVTGLAKKIAAKAIESRLEHAVGAHEWTELGHHGLELFKAIMEKVAAEEQDPDEFFQLLVAAAVANELKDLDPETVAAALEDASGVSSEG